jgi:hypothetical protein
MGALIFLLLVTTRMVGDRAARAVVDASPPSPIPLLSVSASEPPTPDFPEPDVTGPPLEEPEDLEPKVDPHMLALQQRQQEQISLNQQWQDRLNRLVDAYGERTRLLTQRQQLQQAASRRVAAMRSELSDLEVKVGAMTGELSASSAATGTAQERIDLETQIKGLKRRLLAAQQTEANDDALELVPFDVISGTSRRPILIECTSTGLRFIPEDIAVTPDDLAGFTPQVNPLMIGANALVNYWTAWNIRQPNPSREPEPYVLLLVRPSGTVAYYVAMRMLSDLKQPHGYELIEEESVLQTPPVDAGAKAACESAINRLLAERNHVLRQAGSAGFGTGRGPGGNGSGFGSGRGTESGMAGRGTGRGSSIARAGTDGPGTGPSDAGDSGNSNKFELADIMGGHPDAGKGNWERVENFEGARRGGNSPGSAARQSGQSRQTGGSSQSSGAPQSGGGAQAGTIPELGSRQAATGDESQSEGTGTGPVVDVGLGSSGNRSVPVEDQRTQKRRGKNQEFPSEPEQLASRHWGISEPGAAIGLERELRIDVEPKRYIIGKKHVVNIPDADSREDTFVKMVTAIDLHARDWGKPPQGFFWKPQLRYIIADGADANYVRVHQLLERAGLSSTREYPGENPQADAKPKPEKPTKAAVAPADPKPSRRLFRGILR